ncbi:uncharacterized protein FN964_011643 [Alca torda]
MAVFARKSHQEGAEGREEPSGAGAARDAEVGPEMSSVSLAALFCPLTVGTTIRPGFLQQLRVHRHISTKSLNTLHPEKHHFTSKRQPEEASKGLAWITVWAAENSAKFQHYTKRRGLDLAPWCSRYRTAPFAPLHLPLDPPIDGIPEVGINEAEGGRWLQGR